MEVVDVESTLWQQTKEWLYIVTQVFFYFTM